jgi:hypothetical protein
MEQRSRRNASLRRAGSSGYGFFVGVDAGVGDAFEGDAEGPGVGDGASV